MALTQDTLNCEPLIARKGTQYWWKRVSKKEHVRERFKKEKET